MLYPSFNHNNMLLVKPFKYQKQNKHNFKINNSINTQDRVFNLASIKKLV